MLISAARLREAMADGPAKESGVVASESIFFS